MDTTENSNTFTPMDHEALMTTALSIAKSAMHKKEVPIACLFYHIPSSQIIAFAHNQTNLTHNATRHAEMVAIDEILLKYNYDIFKECVLYVTVEPCIMCASALCELRINKVYFGAWNERFGGNGGVLKVNEMVKGREYESVGGILRKEAIMLLRKFYLQENENAPKAKVKNNRVLKFDIPPPKE